jgi:ferredoxin
MAKFRIEIDVEQCTGCAACNASCPDTFEMKEDDKGIPKAKVKKDKADVDELGCSLDAAQVCPVNCIHITDMEAVNKLI